MTRRWSWRFGALLFVALVAVACDDDKTPGGSGGTAGSGGTGGTGGSTPQDSGTPDTVTPTDGGGKPDLPPVGDGGLVPCLDQPGSLDLAPSGRLPCELLPPGFKAP